MKLLLCAFILSLTLTSSACRQRTQDVDQIFGHAVPQNYSFRKDLTYLETTGRLTLEERNRIEAELEDAQQAFGVPKTLLWCLLFQESRFDYLKNSHRKKGARGMGQFTRHALKEINFNTDQYDSRTSEILKEKIKPRRLPINFTLSFEPTEELLENRHREKLPHPPKQSYYNYSTAIFASAAYLNNRYFQIKRALDRQRMIYDPQVIWLFAAAAYNKGAKTVFNLLSHQRAFGGEEAVSELLLNPKLSYALLTHRELMDYSLRDLWDTETREKYIKELTRSMEYIFSCVIPEGTL